MIQSKPAQFLHSNYFGKWWEEKILIPEMKIENNLLTTLYYWHCTCAFFTNLPKKNI